MKKKISLILSLALCITSVALVSSCGNNTDTNTNTNGNTDTESSIVNTETDTSTDAEAKTVAEWAEQNAEEINTILSEKCLDKIVNDCYFGFYTKDQIKTGKWILEGDTEITGIKLLCEVHASGNTAQLQVLDINIKNPMQLYENMELSNIEISSVSLDYNLGYKITDRTSRIDLIDALFKAAGVNEVGGERYLKVIGGSIVSDFGQTSEFVICEVGENEIKEFTINVLSVYGVTTDSEYILKLEDSSNFKIFSPKEIDISGVKVAYVSSES
ncbi:MAG: hypothetical protein IJ437_03175 [Clostridia bacterium]|nr:hypothetical protein [Clostridia bacterium]